MDVSLRQIIKETHKVNRYSKVNKTAQETLDFLEQKVNFLSFKRYQIRGRCFEAFQTAIESKNARLASFAINGLQQMLKDTRMYSSTEAMKYEDLDHWFPMQMIASLNSIKSLSEDVQVEAMRLLLNMTITLPQCLSAIVIINVAKLCFGCLPNANKPTLKNFITNTFLRLVHMFAVKVTDAKQEKNSSEADEDNNDHQDSYPSNNQGPPPLPLTSIAPFNKEFLAIFHFFCDQLASSSNSSTSTIECTLILEGLLVLLSKAPPNLLVKQDFTDLVWQKLCPSLISVLSIPCNHKSIKSYILEDGSTNILSQLSCNAPSSPPSSSSYNASIKAVYSISLKLLQLIGQDSSLRPVLESLFHKMLVHSCPQRRLEVLKALKPLLSNPEDLALICNSLEAFHNNEISAYNKNKTSFNDTTSDRDAINNTKKERSECNVDGNEKKQIKWHEMSKRKVKENMRLIAIIMESLCECSQSGDSNLVLTSIDIVNTLLSTLQLIVFPSSETISDDPDAFLKNEDNTKSSTTCVSNGADKKLYTNGDVNSEDSIEVDSEITDANDTTNGHDDRMKSTGDKIDNVDEMLLKELVDKLVEGMRGVVDVLWRCKDVEEADHILIHFALQFCQDFELKTIPKLNTVASKALTSDFYSTQNSLLTPDTIYIASFASLHFSFLLHQSSYHTSSEKSLPVSMDQFSKELSEYNQISIPAHFVRALFIRLISKDVLNIAKYSDHIDFNKPQSNIFLTLINDLKGFNSKKIGGKMLTNYKTNSVEILRSSFNRENKDEDSNGENNKSSDKKSQNASSKSIDNFLKNSNHSFNLELARNILSQSWDEILTILSTFLLNNKNSSNNLSNIFLLFNGKEEMAKFRSSICLSLHALRKAVVFTSLLGLQDKCPSVFSHLASASCVFEFEEVNNNNNSSASNNTPQGNKANNHKNPSATLKLKKSIASSFNTLTSSFQSTTSSNTIFPTTFSLSSPKLPKIHAAHALSMEALLNLGLELSSHSPDCWKYVFKCCAHISYLEHLFFKYSNTTNNKSIGLTLSTTTSNAYKSNNTYLQNCQDDNDGFQETVAYSNDTNPSLNIREIIERNREGMMMEAGGGILTFKQTSEVLYGLTQLVDRFYDEAAENLNLDSLLKFFSELCATSKQTLENGICAQQSDLSNNLTNTPISSTYHLHHLGDVLLKMVNGNRPLLHVIKAWAVVTPHLVEAAGHKDNTVSRKAIEITHHVITSVISKHLMRIQPLCPQPLPSSAHDKSSISLLSQSHDFHFIQVLFKPFENLLRLEMCDLDVQDQIVSSICELVETSAEGIRGGWKTLFGALRGVKIESNHAFPITRKSTDFSITSDKNILEDAVDNKENKLQNMAVNGHSEDYFGGNDEELASKRSVAAVLDVFEAFIATDNVQVFVSAAVDCILCLLKYISQHDESERSTPLKSSKLHHNTIENVNKTKNSTKIFDHETNNKDDQVGTNEDLTLKKDTEHDEVKDLHSTMPLSKESSIETNKTNDDYNDLFLPSLRYLIKCTECLCKMYQLEDQCPSFSGIQRIYIKGKEAVNLVIPNMNIHDFTQDFYFYQGEDDDNSDVVDKVDEKVNNGEDGEDGKEDDDDNTECNSTSTATFAVNHVDKDVVNNEEKDAVNNEKKDGVEVVKDGEDHKEADKNIEKNGGKVEGDVAEKDLCKKDSVENHPKHEHVESCGVEGDETIEKNESITDKKNGEVKNKDDDDDSVEAIVNTENKQNPDDVIKNDAIITEKQDESNEDIRKNCSENDIKGDVYMNYASDSEDCFKSIEELHPSYDRNNSDKTDSTSKCNDDDEDIVSGNYGSCVSHHSEDTDNDAEEIAEENNETFTLNGITFNNNNSRVLQSLEEKNMGQEKMVEIDKNDFIIKKLNDERKNGNSAKFNIELDRINYMDNLDDIDNPGGVLHVFYLLIEGLTTASLEVTARKQTACMETLFSIVRSVAACPGPRFAFYCFNGILMPALQHSFNKLQAPFSTSSQDDTTTFKLFTGMLVDLLVDFINRFIDQTGVSEQLLVAMESTMLLFVELVARCEVTLSRLGCSCIRHLLMNTGHVLSNQMWEIAGRYLCIACEVSLYHVKRLMTPFLDQSDQCQGDIGQVKIVVENHNSSSPTSSSFSSPVRNAELKMKQMNEQIFLLDRQTTASIQSKVVEKENINNIVLILYSPYSSNSQDFIASIPLSFITTSLVSHQLLIQIVANLMLAGVKHMVPLEKPILSHQLDSSHKARRQCSCDEDEGSEKHGEKCGKDCGGHCGKRNCSNVSLPGWLSSMPTKTVLCLLDCLIGSYSTHENFNKKPGLKVLLQKTMGFDAPANLYKQALTSMTLYTHVLLEILTSTSPSALSSPTHNVCRACQSKLDLYSYLMPEKLESLNEKPSISQALSIPSSCISSPLTSTPSSPFCSPANQQSESLSKTLMSDRIVVHFREVFVAKLQKAFETISQSYLHVYEHKDKQSVCDRLSSPDMVLLRITTEELKVMKAKAKLTNKNYKHWKARKDINSSFGLYHHYFQPKFHDSSLTPAINHTGTQFYPSNITTSTSFYAHSSHLPQPSPRKLSSAYIGKKLCDEEESTFYAGSSVLTLESTVKENENSKEHDKTVDNGDNVDNSNKDKSNEVTAENKKAESDAKHIENDKFLDESVEKASVVWDCVELVDWWVVDMVGEIEGWKSMQKRLFPLLNRYSNEMLQKKYKKINFQNENGDDIDSIKGRSLQQKRSNFKLRNFKSGNFSNMAGKVVASSAAKNIPRKTSFDGFGVWSGRIKRDIFIDDAVSETSEIAKSLLKDSEAEYNSLVHMMTNLVQHYNHLPNHSFHSLLPLFYGHMVHLISNCDDKSLRKATAKWLDRVAKLFKFDAI